VGVKPSVLYTVYRNHERRFFEMPVNWRVVRANRPDGQFSFHRFGNAMPFPFPARKVSQAPIACLPVLAGTLQQARAFRHRPMPYFWNGRTETFTPMLERRCRRRLLIFTKNDSCREKFRPYHIITPVDGGQQRAPASRMRSCLVPGIRWEASEVHGGTIAKLVKPGRAKKKREPHLVRVAASTG
jgi:hypothetical protein